MPTKESFLEQRRQLLGLLAVASAGLMSGCSLFARREVQPICLTSPEVSFPGGPLTIDAHCHVFNGTDLQVKEFFSKVAVRQGGALGFGAQVLGSILQSMAWSSAPTGEVELRELRSLAGTLKSCADKEHMVRVAALRQSACVFHAIWTVIPRQTGHPFHGKLDSRSVATRGELLVL